MGRRRTGVLERSVIVRVPGWYRDNAGSRGQLVLRGSSVRMCLAMTLVLGKSCRPIPARYYVHLDQNGLSNYTH